MERPYRRATVTDAPCAPPRSLAAPMMREKMAWCSQRGVALVNITLALFAQPGTTLMRLACNARIPARTTGAGCIFHCHDVHLLFDVSAAFLHARACSPRTTMHVDIAVAMASGVLRGE